jgi:hypothetical protein
MTTHIQILRDLIAGQSSIDAMAQRLHQPCKVLAAYLADLETQNLVISHTLKDTLLIYRLTQPGLQLATTPNSKLRVAGASGS